MSGDADLIRFGKRILMIRLDCSADAAELVLINLADRSETTMVGVAEALIDPTTRDALIAVATAP